MTDHSTARALVEKLWKRRNELTDAEWLEAAPVLLGFCVSALTSPEGDTLSDEVVEGVAKAIMEDRIARMGADPSNWAVNDALRNDARAAIAALQSRVSPQEGLREALEEARWYVKSYHRDHGGSKTARLLAKIDAALSASPSKQETPSHD